MPPTSAEIVASYRDAFRKLTRGWEQGERLGAFMYDSAEVIAEYEPGWAEQAHAAPAGKFQMVGVPSAIGVPGKLEGQALAGFDPDTRTVFLRDERVTDEFRALLTAHSLLHAFDAITEVRAALIDAAGGHEGALRAEVRAYELEMDFADQMTGGRFFQTLDELMMEMGQQEERHFLEEESPPRLNRLFPPPLSQREGATRLTFFSVAAAYWYADTVAARTKLRFMDEWWRAQASRY